MPVLESEGVVTMRLFGNSTRIARWNADLGFKSCPRFLTCIKNINLEGGTIPCFEAVVVRKYGLKFMTQQDKSGTKVVRSYEEERDYRTNSETRVEAQLHEVFFNFVFMEFLNQLVSFYPILCRAYC